MTMRRLGVLYLAITLLAPLGAFAADLAGNWVRDTQRKTVAKPRPITITQNEAGTSYTITRGNRSMTFIADGQLRIVDGDQIRATLDGDTLVVVRTTERATITQRWHRDGNRVVVDNVRVRPTGTTTNQVVYLPSP